MCTQKVIQYLIFAALVGISGSSAVIIADNVIIPHSQESKAKQIIMSKKLWGALAGLALIASGVGALWLGRYLFISRKIEEVKDGIINLIDKHKDAIQKFTIQVCYGDKELSYKKYGWLTNPQKYNVDAVVLLINRYKITTCIYTKPDLDSADNKNIEQLLDNMYNKTFIEEKQRDSFGLLATKQELINGVLSDRFV